jgi:hypothetical protein
MPVPAAILQLSDSLGRQQGASIAEETPLPGSVDLPDQVLAQIEERHGVSLSGLDLCEVEQAYCEGLLQARCERGVTVRIESVGDVVLKGDSADVLAAAVTLATTPPADLAPAGLRALLESDLAAPILLVPPAGPPITLSPPRP